MTELDESLFKISKDLMLREPFYGLFLIMTNKSWSDKIPTAGVSRQNVNYNLLINPTFWQGLSYEHKLGLFKHELLHLVFFHPLMRDDFADKHLFNIAADCEINQYISPELLPEGGILPSTFPDLNLPLKAGTKAYYDLLQKSGCPNLKSMLDAMKKGQNVIVINNKNVNLPSNNWSDFDNLSEADRKLLEAQTQVVIENAVDSVMKTCGSIPGEIKEILKNFEVQPEKFNWKAYIRRFVGNANKIYTKKLKRKFNKRFEENPGLKIKKRNHILVAIDTSVSVATEELKEFFSEIHHIYKKGVQVTVVQCDTKIKSIKNFKPDMNIEIHGRGGTSFDPVLEYYDENSKIYDALIYFTDGECSTSYELRKPLLWVLSSQSKENNNLPGYTIKLS